MEWPTPREGARERGLREILRVIEGGEGIPATEPAGKPPPDPRGFRRGHGERFELSRRSGIARHPQSFKLGPRPVRRAIAL